MELTLFRTCYPGGSNGMLFYKNSLLCYTIELPWLNNANQHSCIPEGTYRLQLRYSTKFKTHLQLMDVPGRELILIHPANDAIKELKGCIAPVTRNTGEGKGIMSRMALEQIKEVVFCHIDREPVFITIKNNNNDSSKQNDRANTTVL